MFECVVRRFFEAAAIADLWPQALHELGLACGAPAATPGPALPLSIERAIGEDSLQDKVARMDELITHLRAAGDLAIRVGMASTQRMADAFSMAGHPVALLGRDGFVIHMNARFERLIGDGVCVRGGRLGSWLPEAGRALEVAICRALNYEGTKHGPLTSVVLPRQNGLRPLVAQVVPVVGMAHDAVPLVSAIVTVTDLEAARMGPEEAVLEQAFGLTPAEARLASQVAAGKTLADIAKEEGSARETLRSRLKSIFEKTGTGRQAELTLLLSKIARS